MFSEQVFRMLTASYSGATWRSNANFVDAPANLSRLFQPSNIQYSYTSHPKHLHNLVAQVVDHLYGNPSRFRPIERPRGIAAQGFPSFLIDLGFEGSLEGFVGVVRTEEICLTNEKAFTVVVRIHEPACDAVGAVAADFAGVGMEHVDAMNGNL